jgi:hypothetical protein
MYVCYTLYVHVYIYVSLCCTLVVNPTKLIYIYVSGFYTHVRTYSSTIVEYIILNKKYN